MGPALGRMTIGNLVEQAQFGRLRVGDRDTLEQAALVEDIDHAPIGQHRGRELGDMIERRVKIEGRAEQETRLRQECRALAGGLGRMAGGLCDRELLAEQLDFAPGVHERIAIVVTRLAGILEAPMRQ